MAIPVHIVKGVANWAKIVGPAKENNFGEVVWEFDLTIDADTKKGLVRQGFPTDKIKHDDRGDYIPFKRKLMRQDGTQANPYTILDQYGEPWDGKTLIGNGSKVQVKYMTSERRFKGKVTLKPEALEICVTDLVPYKPNGGFEFKAKPQVKNPDQHGEEPWEQGAA